MSDFDVFNGDADGICALTQLRLAEPRNARLVTGVKRDIELLGQVEGRAGDRVTVLDVSLDKNRADVQRLLALGVEIFYVDHHFAGEIPQGPGLTSIINESPDVCTSLLINGHLKNRYLAWAVTGAFGDNLRKSAETLARPLELSEAQLGNWRISGPISTTTATAVASTICTSRRTSCSASSVSTNLRLD